MTRDVAAQLAAARARIAELEALEAERARAADVQVALYRIAEAASAATDLQSFYRTIHAIVGELMYAENLYIALYDEVHARLNYPYYVDAFDTDIPDPNAWEPFGVGQATGVTAYALRLGEPVFLDSDTYNRLHAAGEIEALGLTSDESAWLGVPLRADGKLLGLLVAQSYSNEHPYTRADLDLLAFVGQHVASALTRARAIEETRQRNAELAVINEIGDALARQLDFQAIIQLVGDRVRTLFEARSMFIALHDPDTNLISWPYDIDEGVAFDRDPLPLGPGLTSTVIRTGRPVRSGSNDEADAAGAIQIGGTDTESWLGAPITGAARVIGVLGMESVAKDAYTEADERRVATLASSMGVALENARLFDETKRLLIETDERAAELAIVNEVQQGWRPRSRCRRCTTSSATGCATSSTPRSWISESLTVRLVSSTSRTRSSAASAFPTSRSHDGHPQARHRDPGAAAHERAGGRAGGRSSAQPGVLQGEEPKSTLWAPLPRWRRGHRRGLGAESRPRAGLL